MAEGDGVKRACCWFTDPHEAKAILRAVSAANPDAGLKLACHGMGGAFEVCVPDGVSEGMAFMIEVTLPDFDQAAFRVTFRGRGSF